MLSQPTIKYALFPNPEVARLAAERLERTNAKVELVTEAEELDQDRLPLASRSSLILSLAVTSGLLLAALTGVVFYLVDGLPDRLGTAYAVTATTIVLATAIGGLAGIVTDRTRAQEEAQRLRELLRRGKGVMLFEPKHELGGVFRHLGATRTGTLA